MYEWMSMSINFMSMDDEYEYQLYKYDWMSMSMDDENEYQLYEYDWMSMEKAKSFFAVDLWCETQGLTRNSYFEKEQICFFYCKSVNLTNELVH